MAAGRAVALQRILGRPHVLTSDSDIWPSPCFPGEPPASTGRLRIFADAVEHGYIGSICAPSYGPFFTDAVSKVRPLCDASIPQ
jgi:hypothetical protein